MKLWVLCMICVATSDGNQHWKLQPKILPLVLLGYSDFDHTHLSSLQWSQLSDQRTLLQTANLLKCQKWSPYKGEEKWFLHLRKERNGPSYCKPKPIYSQPKQPLCAWCVVCMLPFLPSILLFFSSVRPFFKMDCTN